MVAVAAGFLLSGNLAILAASALAQVTAPRPAVDVPDEVASIRNFTAIDGTLWRGGAVTRDQYRALADAGVETIIDLRAEDDLDVPEDLLAVLGLRLVVLPIRDGQAPSPTEVQRFLDVVNATDGRVYLHCGAGVGRTGTLAAAYSVAHGAGGLQAMRANLAVGPPSLEQLVFAASLDSDEAAERPNPVLVAVSRTLDAPRRIWKSVEGH